MVFLLFSYVSCSTTNHWPNIYGRYRPTDGTSPYVQAPKRRGGRRGKAVRTGKGHVALARAVASGWEISLWVDFGWNHRKTIGLPYMWILGWSHRIAMENHRKTRRKTIGKWWLSKGFYGIYPPVICYMAMENGNLYLFSIENCDFL